jgi:hypothetical protein
LVRFSAPPLLQRDKQGYLVLGGHDADGSPAYARIGEMVEWELGNRHRGDSLPPLISDAAALAAIHAACGLGEVVAVPSRVSSVSLARFRGREAAVRDFMDRYGVSEAEARRKIGRGGGSVPCAPLPPQPPVPAARLCPPGTRYAAGLCRTPEGYIRPVP